jgi:hypothetical protein
MTLVARQNLKRLSSKAIHGDPIVDETEKMNQAVRFRGQRPRPRPSRHGSPPAPGQRNWAMALQGLGASDCKRGLCRDWWSVVVLFDQYLNWLVYGVYKVQFLKSDVPRPCMLHYDFAEESGWRITA